MVMQSEHDQKSCLASDQKKFVMQSEHDVLARVYERDVLRSKK